MFESYLGYWGKRTKITQWNWTQQIGGGSDHRRSFAVSTDGLWGLSEGMETKLITLHCNTLCIALVNLILLFHRLLYWTLLGNKYTTWIMKTHHQSPWTVHKQCIQFVVGFPPFEISENKQPQLWNSCLKLKKFMFLKSNFLSNVHSITLTCDLAW